MKTLVSLQELFAHQCVRSNCQTQLMTVNNLLPCSSNMRAKTITTIKHSKQINNKTIKQLK